MASEVGAIAEGWAYVFLEEEDAAVALPLDSKKRKVGGREARQMDDGLADDTLMIEAPKSLLVSEFRPRMWIHTQDVDRRMIGMPKNLNGSGTNLHSRSHQ